MEKWVVCAKRADFQKISQEFGIDPVIARLIRNRDVEGTENIRSYLYGTLKELPSPWLLKDMDKAVEILQEKIKEHRKIRIIGDYDIDGVTSTCILLKGFQRLGADADTYIPDRIKDGYGIHEQLIQKAVEDGIDTIVTCDNGIAASAEIADAKERGLTVVITDHHDIPFQETENGKEWIARVEAEKNRLNPDCAVCKGKCGRTDNYDLEELETDDPADRALKEELLAGLFPMAEKLQKRQGSRTEEDEKQKSDDRTAVNFIYKALFAIGNYVGEKRLKSVVQEMKALRERY